MAAQRYLSGDVRAKLAVAEVVATRDPRFEANVAAQRAVVPADLGPDEIRARLRVPWVEAADIAAFVTEHWAVTRRW